MRSDPRLVFRSPLERRLSRFGLGVPFEEIREEMDRLWNTLSVGTVSGRPLGGDRWGDGGPLPSNFPAVNVQETDEAIVVEAELPGVNPADLDVSAVGDELVIKGSRPSTGEPEKEETGWLRRERGVGGFERRIDLPVAIDPSKVEATLVDGVLTLRCTKAAECQPHKIEIRS